MSLIAMFAVCFRVLEDLSSYDVMYLKTKCPAFKDSCPFVEIADNDLKKAIQNCPEFTDGCPFKDVKNLEEIYKKLSQIPDPQCPSKRLSEVFETMHMSELALEQTVGNCPVFHQDGGCPFKSVRSNGVSLVDPIESVAHSERLLKKLVKVEVSSIKEKCPAFKETLSCPYAKLSDGELKMIIEKCPEFTNGCSFKTVQNMADMCELLIPDPQSPEKMLVKTQQNIHSVSRDQKSVSGDCPVFHNKDGETT